jgi:WD40 repeat protein
VTQHPTSSSMAVSCGEDRVIKLWSLNDGICIHTILCKSKPLSATFSRDGNFIVSSHFDGALHAFDASTGAGVQHLDGVHSGQCIAVVPTRQPYKMVSVGRDNCVCVSDIYNPKVRYFICSCA